MQARGYSHDQAIAALNRTIDVQAYMLGANDIFYASALLFVALIGVVWLARPVKQRRGRRRGRRRRALTIGHRSHAASADAQLRGASRTMPERQRASVHRPASNRVHRWPWHRSCEPSLRDRRRRDGTIARPNASGGPPDPGPTQRTA